MRPAVNPLLSCSEKYLEDSHDLQPALCSEMHHASDDNWKRSLDLVALRKVASIICPRIDCAGWPSLDFKDGLRGFFSMLLRAKLRCKPARREFIRRENAAAARV